MAARKKKKEIRLRTYRYWFRQVNQTVVDVTALDGTDPEFIATLAERKWKRENAPPDIISIAEIPAAPDE